MACTKVTVTLYHMKHLGKEKRYITYESFIDGITYRSLKFQVDITNHQLTQDRQQERSQREPKAAVEEEKEA
jgi:hypothetical protein